MGKYIGPKMRALMEMKEQPRKRETYADHLKEVEALHKSSSYKKAIENQKPKLMYIFKSKPNPFKGASEKEKKDYQNKTGRAYTE